MKLFQNVKSFKSKSSISSKILKIKLSVYNMNHELKSLFLPVYRSLLIGFLKDKPKASKKYVTMANAI